MEEEEESLHSVTLTHAHRGLTRVVEFLATGFGDCQKLELRDNLYTVQQRVWPTATHKEVEYEFPVSEFLHADPSCLKSEDGCTYIHVHTQWLG